MKKLFAKISFNPDNITAELLGSFVHTMTKGMGKELDTEALAPNKYRIMLETGHIINTVQNGEGSIEVWK
jgi:hypothetical protein